MTRRASFALLALVFLVGACAGASNPADPDGGTRDPDGGEPQLTGDCRIEGYPCSPAEMSPEARALSLQYADEVRDRIDAGESFEDVATWLDAQDDVVHVIGDESALRFRVTGGSALWFYDPGPGIARPSPSAPAPKSSALHSPPSPSTAPKAIVRRDDSDTSIKKKALILEPFEEFIVTPVNYWVDQLGELHDYESVHHLQNRDVQNEHFANWNDYRFVWVTTHGKHLPSAKPKFSALFSGRMCQEHGWLQEEIEAGRGDERTKDGMSTLRALFARPRAVVEAHVSPEQAARWKAFEDRQEAEITRYGVFCGGLKMDWIFVPGYEPGDPPLFDVSINYWGYDELFFEEEYPSGLKNTLVYQRACTSHALPLKVASGARGAILGWSDVINSADDDQTIAVLFDRLITKGETLEHALKAVFNARVHQFTRGEYKPQLQLVRSGKGGQKIRIRETVSITDPLLLKHFPDEGGMLEAREITASNDTVVDVTVEIEGFGEYKGEVFELQFFDGDGRAISQKRKVDEPRDDKAIMVVPISLRQAIRTPTEVEIEARVTLPEDSGAENSRHPIKLTVGPAIESLWTLNVGGAGSARGDFVFAPFPMALQDEQGRLIWQVSLAQLDEFGVPMATVLIADHSGRTLECTGQTGLFEAAITVMFNDDPMPTEGYGGGFDGGECGEAVYVDIVSFSKEDDLVANVSGTICHWKKVGDEVVVTPVPISGRFQMPSAGCGAPQGGDRIGSYTTGEEPSLCFDIYPNAAIAPAWDEVCSMGGGLICSEDPCPTAGQIGQCDYRNEAVQISFRGQVQHFLPGSDWPPVGDLEAGCEFQLGTWTTGQPAMP